MTVEHKYSSFQEFFLDTLPNGGFWKSLFKGEYIFRGESTNKYSLLPTALREENHSKLWDISGRKANNVADYEWWQILTEYTNIVNFYKTANDNGLKIPTNDLTNQNYLNRSPDDVLRERTSFKWIIDEIAEIAALAQHYGIMTRLLDWTQNFYTACYFASSGACKMAKESNFNKTDYMIIWVLDVSLIKFYQHGRCPVPLKFVVPSYYNNPNINAQQGILSCWEVNIPNYMDFNDKPVIVDRTPLDKLLEQYSSANNVQMGFLHKIMIPITDCADMYQTISRLGYTASRLFPGYNGVTKQLEEEAYVRKIAEQMKNGNN